MEIKKGFNRLLDSLSRVTSSGKFIPEIDGMRFFCLYYMMAYHVETSLFTDNFHSEEYKNSIVYYIIRNAHHSVPVFFVISGFILALPFISSNILKKKKISLGNYFQRRLTRIEPPYIIAMLLLYILFSFTTTYPIGEYWTRFLHSVTYTHSLNYGFEDVVNPVAWSLEVEVQFYLLAPLLFLLFKLPKYWREITLVMLLISIATYNDFTNQFQHDVSKYPNKLNLLGQGQYFLAGALLAILYVFKLKNLSKNYWYDVLAISMMLIYFLYPMTVFQLTVCLFLMFIGVFNGPLLSQFFSKKFIVVLGGMCYSTYLLHLPITQIITNNIGKHFTTNSYYWDLLIYTILSFGASIVISSLFFYYIEKPFMQPNVLTTLKQKLGFKSSGKPQSAQDT